jgi:hypothetical protein
MLELTTTGRLVDYETLEDRSDLAAVLARKELEAAVESGEPAQLWLELGLAGADEEETARVGIELLPAELADILSRTGGSDVAFVFDEDALEAALEDSEVEAHGLRSALAIAATSAAVLAPAGMAAVPQSVETAATAQRVSSAATAQAMPAASRQVTPAVESQVVRSQVVKGQVVKSQLSKRLVFKGLVLQHGGLAR